MPVYKLTLCYDGTRYRGWQKQGNTPNTLQEKIESLLSRLLGTPCEVQGCGRTDAGVHAKMQVCSFRTEAVLDTQSVLCDIRTYLPQDIGAISLETADSRFHARLCCREKTYVYRIWTDASPNVFERKYLYTHPCAPDLARIERAIPYLTGTHDFTAFTTDKRMRTGKKSAVRTIFSIQAERTGEGGRELRLTFTGDGFLYNMVRILAGTLLLVATGDMDPEDIPGILCGRDRALAGPTLPPEGLTLYDIRY